MKLNDFDLTTIEEYFVKGLMHDITTGILEERNQAWEYYEKFEKGIVDASANGA